MTDHQNGKETSDQKMLNKTSYKNRLSSDRFDMPFGHTSIC